MMIQFVSDAKKQYLILLTSFLLILPLCTFSKERISAESSPQARGSIVTQKPNLVNAPVTPLDKKEDKVSKKLGKRQKQTEKIARKIQRKLSKKRGLEEDITFEDAIVLAGAIVVVLGIVSILFNPLGAIITIVLGLAAYLIGKHYGGSLDAFF